jgi:phenylpyruvate tautomerase PptA (4-oxalocrotonate tautomerase family)
VSTVPAFVTGHQQDTACSVDTRRRLREHDSRSCLTLIQLTVSDTRTVDPKKRLLAKIAENLARNPGLRPDDIFINLAEVKKENWSFGRGVAQYA